MVHQNSVLLFQELTHNAWPCRQHLLLNGWILRISEGYTQRANSVLPLHYHGTDPVADIHIAEVVYQKTQLSKIIFQIPDCVAPPSLDEVLATIGYEKKSKTIVMTKTLDNQVVTKTIRDDLRYECDQNHVRWLNFKKMCSMDMNTYNPLLEKIIERIVNPAPRFFYTIANKEIIGGLLGVVERGYFGLFGLEVSPHHRRKHVALSLMQYIIEWCKTNQVHTIYLQVEEVNNPALVLYQKLGFIPAYFYHYRTKKL